MFLGIFILVKFLQLLNAPNPISVTVSGISRVVNLEQFENAFSPILSVPLEIFTSVNPAHQ